MEEIKELPTPICTINCSLNELKENIAIISREYSALHTSGTEVYLYLTASILKRISTAENLSLLSLHSSHLC